MSGYAPVLAFGEFRLDTGRRLLLAGDGRPAPLGVRAFEVLLHLVSRPGELVTKSALIQAAWPGLHVEENNLSQCISTLRRALGENGSDRRFIATEPGRGYRFVAPVSDGEVSAHASKRRRITDNAQAHHLYVAGWYALTRPGGRTLEKGVAQLEHAIRIDPDFTLAHACLGGVYSLSGVFGVAAPHAVFPKARAAIQRALALAPDLAPAHSEMGHILAVYDLDFTAAEASYQRALALDPGHPHALHMKALREIYFARCDEALKLLYDALAGDPLAVNISSNIGMAHYYAGRYHEALAQLKASLDLDPLYAHTHGLVGRCLRQLGDYSGALESFERRIGVSISSRADIPVTLALKGELAVARRMADEMIAERDWAYVSAFDIAEVFAAMGEADAALDWLDTAYDERAQPINMLLVEPTFRGLRGHDRFQGLLRRLGVAS